MLRIKIGEEFLELQPGTELEWQQENPFLQFGDEILGDYSLPIEVKPTPTNLRLLNYAGLLQKRFDDSGIDAAIYDGGVQVAIGKIKVEKPSVNVNTTAAGTISIYFLGGIASFYQDIKEKKLREINLGGERSFQWQGSSIDLIDVGDDAHFWSHIHNVMNAAVGAYDYAFYPVINKSSEALDVMNAVVQKNGNLSMRAGDTNTGKMNPIVPFPYLHYVLKKVFQYVGWELNGDLLNDDDYKAITIVNFRSIDWCQGVGRWGFFESSSFKWFKGNNPVKFDLVDHLPDWTIADFLINLKKRIGLWYDFDRKTKAATIKKLKDVVATEVKDVTFQANPLVVKKVLKEKRIYALRSTQEGGPNWKEVQYKGVVNSKGELPAASEAQYKHVYLVLYENNYYCCRLNDAGTAWEWGFYSGNVFDVEPDGYTEEIVTKCITISNEAYVGTGSDTMDFVPRYDASISWGLNEGDTTDVMPLLFYNGKIRNTRGKWLPYASAHPYYIDGRQFRDWSLSFEFKLIDGTDVGLYENWRPVLELLETMEDLEANLHLDLVDYLNLKFSDLLSIKNVRFYVKTIKATIPYKNALNTEGIRV